MSANAHLGDVRCILDVVLAVTHLYVVHSLAVPRLSAGVAGDQLRPALPSRELPAPHWSQRSVRTQGCRHQLRDAAGRGHAQGYSAVLQHDHRGAPGQCGGLDLGHQVEQIVVHCLRRRQALQARAFQASTVTGANSLTIVRNKSSVLLPVCRCAKKSSEMNVTLKATEAAQR